MKKILWILAIFIAGTVIWYFLSLRPVDAADDVRRNVNIPAGSSVASIAGILQEKGIIRSARAFTLYVRLHGSQGSLQAGDFVLQPSQSVPEVIETLRTGFSEEISLTIPEGYTVKDIDALLAEKELLRPGEFLACAQECDLTGFGFLPAGVALAKRGGKVEGYLFPDTYFVVRDGFTAQAFLSRLLETFRKRVIDGLGAEIGASKRTLNDVIAMASLVEEETRTRDERPVVAGILWKRFDAGQGLGVDAAVRYVLDKPTAAITVADLDVDSPYNLRKFRGLPPGPIANPGISSIVATLQPKDSPYWYYLHGNDGVIRYAETNDEHNKNRALYLQ